MRKKSVEYIKSQTRELFLQAANPELTDEQRNQLHGQIFELNVPLARKAADKFSRKPEDFDENFSACLLGLLRAVQGYDLQRGYEFSTYAFKAMQRNWSRSMGSRESFNISEDRLKEIRRLRSARGQLFQQLGRKPTMEELAKELFVSVETVENWQRASMALGSASSGSNLDERGRPFEQLVVNDEPNYRLLEDTMTNHSFVETVRDALHSGQFLQEDVSMFRELFEDGQSVREIGKEHGVSYETVRKRMIGMVRALRIEFGLDPDEPVKLPRHIAPMQVVQPLDRGIERSA